MCRLSVKCGKIPDNYNSFMQFSTSIFKRSASNLIYFSVGSFTYSTQKFLIYLPVFIKLHNITYWLTIKLIYIPDNDYRFIVQHTSIIDGSFCSEQRQVIIHRISPICFIELTYFIHFHDRASRSVDIRCHQFIICITSCIVIISKQMGSKISNSHYLPVSSTESTSDFFCKHSSPYKSRNRYFMRFTIKIRELLFFSLHGKIIIY